MTKKELIEKASQISGIPQTQIKECLEAIIKVILNTLAEKQNVKIRNFGTFWVKDLKPRKAMNPRENKQISLGERSLVKFKISPIFFFKKP